MTIHYLASGIIIVSWLVFLSYWVIASFFVKRSTSSRARLRTPTLALRVLMYLFIVVLIYEDVVHKISFGPYEAFFQAHPPLELVGALCAVLGVAFAVWARVYLASNWGMPMTLRENPKLVTTGPYRYVRHPIYTGVILALFGSAAVSGTWWALVFIASVFYFTVSAFQEERDLVEKFPDTYPAYKARTKMLIPFVL